MSAIHTANASLCPVCGVPNECQLCTTAAYKGPCWCMNVSIPDALVEQVPAESRNRQCICRHCVEAFHTGTRGNENRPSNAAEYYFDRDNLMVFTPEYLLQRGYCCGNGCRHCPYPESK